MRALTCSLWMVLVAGQAGGASLTFQSPGFRVAVLPIDNLTGAAAPTRKLLVKLEASLARAGVEVVGGEPVQQYLADQRLRATGSIDRQSARVAGESLHVDAVLITSLVSWREGDPPKLGLTMRLVQASEEAAILWADGLSRAGDDTPGFLSMGVVETLPPLEDQVLERLSRSLAAFTHGRPRVLAEDCRKGLRFGPKMQFRSPALDSTEPWSVAVVPFLNATKQRRAGELLAAEFVRGLSEAGMFRVIEPGAVRDVLLRYRVVIPGGVNLETTRELLGALEADMVLGGTVLEYEDLNTVDGPRVRFSATLLDSHTGKVLWQSTSYSHGTDGVILFDVGDVRTGSGLACRMVNAVVRGFEGKGVAEPEALEGPDWFGVSRVKRVRPVEPGVSAADCTAPLPRSAMEVDTSDIEPPLIDRRPGRVGEAVHAVRAIQVRFNPTTGAMLPGDAEALSMLARCAAAQGHDVVVRALIAPTPEQLMDAGRRTVNALRTGAVDKLRRERIRLEIRSTEERSNQIEVLVAVVPGAPLAPSPGPGSTPAGPPGSRVEAPAPGSGAERAAPAGEGRPQPGLEAARPGVEARPPDGDATSATPNAEVAQPARPKPGVESRPAPEGEAARAGPNAGAAPPTPEIDRGPAAESGPGREGDAAVTAATSEAIRAANTKYQEAEREALQRASQIVERAAALEERARKLAADEKALAGPSGKLPTVGAAERELAQLEARQVATEKRLLAVQVTLTANEARRKQEESAAMAEAARVRREHPAGPARLAAEEAVRRARERRQEATAERQAVQEKQLAAIEARLELQAKRLETAGTPQDKLRTGEAGRRQLAAALDARRPDIQRCVQSFLKRNPTATRQDGVLDLTIDPRGRVTTAAASGTWRGSYLEECLKTAARAWRFPATGEEYHLEAPLTVVGQP